MKKVWTLLLAVAMMSVATLSVAASGESSDESHGELIYEETFEYADQADHVTTLLTLNWAEQNKAMGAYTDPTARLSISGGRLAVIGASDTYFLILNEERMKAYDGQTITIQYDVEYTTAGDTSRYFTILGNYAGKRYNSFHFRNRGTGNNQVHFDGSWLNYDAYRSETDAYSAAEDSGNGSSIAMKLLGKKYDGTSLFSRTPVTIRYVLDSEAGAFVYMKLAEQDEGSFVLVSKPDDSANGYQTYGTWNANAVCLKIGGEQDGYIDNIAVWTGNGNYPVKPEPEPEETTPAETEQTEPAQTQTPEGQESGEPQVPDEPEQVKEPHTVANKIALWGVALFGGWILVKKGKEEKEK